MKVKEILISIQPKWCELIVSGKKDVEVRKTKPKIDTPFKCYIYCTYGEGLIEANDEVLPNHLIGLKVSKNKIWSNCCNGKVIGEFVCERIQKYECEFVDDDCYEEIASIFVDEDGDETGFIEWSNDCDFSYEHIDLYDDSCIEYEELKKYMGVGFGTFYGWHISDLVIYDKPKELSEFFKHCGDNPKCDGCEAHYYSNTECGEEDYCCSVVEGCKPLKRPFQSWGYVEGFGKLQSSKEKA
jgi:predicted transcriptional regulator